MKSLFSTLEAILEDLDEGIEIKNVGHQLRFEKQEVYRIGQGNKRQLESRLYVYFSVVEEKVILLYVGTKDRQNDDIAKAVEIKNHYIDSGEFV